MRIITACFVACSLALGCGDGSEAEADARLRLVPEPSSFASPAFENGTFVSDEGLRLDASLYLGWGEGYAESVEINDSVLVSPQNFSGCLISGDFIDRTLEVVGLLEAEPEGNGHFVLSPMAPGEATITIRGPYEVAATDCPNVMVGDRIDAELRIDVTTRERFRVEWEVEECGGGASVLPVQSGAVLRGVAARALDEEGEEVRIANASLRGQVPITVQARSGIRLETSARQLSSLRATGGAGTVTLIPDVGEILELELITPPAIDSARVESGLDGGHWGVALQDGDAYQIPAGEDSLHIGVTVPAVRTGGVTLCSKLDFSDFQLSTHTPEICGLGDPDSRPTFKLLSTAIAGPFLREYLKIHEMGECRYSVSAPSYAGGAGWSIEFANSISTTQP